MILSLGSLILFYFILKIFLFIYVTEIDSQREREHSRGSGRGRSRLPAEEPDVGLDPKRQDHALSRRQTLNDCATHQPLPSIFLRFYLFI